MVFPETVTPLKPVKLIPPFRMASTPELFNLLLETIALLPFPVEEFRE